MLKGSFPGARAFPCTLAIHCPWLTCILATHSLKKYFSVPLKARWGSILQLQENAGVELNQALTALGSARQRAFSGPRPPGSATQSQRPMEMDSLHRRAPRTHLHWKTSFRYGNCRGDRAVEEQDDYRRCRRDHPTHGSDLRNLPGVLPVFAPRPELLRASCNLSHLGRVLERDFGA